MTLEQARKELLELINLACGFKVPEFMLTPHTRQSIGSLASTCSQLVIIREFVTIDKKNDARLVSKVGKSTRGRYEVDLEKNLATIEELQETLNERLDSLAFESSQNPSSAQTAELAWACRHRSW